VETELLKSPPRSVLYGISSRYRPSNYRGAVDFVIPFWRETARKTAVYPR